MGGAALTLPPALRPGDLLAVAAPASAFDRPAFRRGAEAIAARGYRVAYRDDIFGHSGSFAGADERRAAELNGWIRNPEVKAILVARGGWGTARIADRLDYRVLARRPQAIAGFSDLTTLLLAVTQRAGIAAFHGPMVASAGADPRGIPDLSRLLALLAGAAAPRAHRGLRGLRPGRARAPLTGGNLGLLAHAAGTPFAIEARGRILFVEEVNEPLYRVDRAVRQLLLAGVFRGIAGLVLGRFSGMKAAELRCVPQLFLEALGSRRVPVVAGFPAGHGRPNRAIPFGVPATLDAEAGTLLFDPCVQLHPTPPLR
ncbi:MAG TPA: LD-carboxypeptidase [Candidatus Methanoperedens sp.]|nr:LD-carboxypeptidase [Candidatus Methanoperedens sp.]